MLLSLVLSAAAAAATEDGLGTVLDLPRRCSSAEQLVLTCINASHYTLTPCSTPDVDINRHTMVAAGKVKADSSIIPCRSGYSCSPSTGSCVADGGIAIHLQRSVDYQISESAPATEQCNAVNPGADAAAGLMFCKCAGRVGVGVRGGC